MNWIKQMSDKISGQQDFVLITLIDYKGSVPQALGAKAVVNEKGLLDGTVGGGKVEARAIEFAQDILKKSDSPVCQMVTWNLTTDIKMTCGGVVTFLFEVSRNKPWKIVVFGAGHVAQELVPLLTKLNCHVTCIDQRSEWLEKIPQAANLVKKQAEHPKDLVQNFSNDCFFVLMTQGHANDLPILAEILKQHHEAAYIGVIGSKTKALSLKSNLQKMDFTEEQIEKFNCPIGLDFGNNTPIEISYSVIAQLLQQRDHLALSTAAARV
ncbi:xanthine dehydrogenase accessory protein XdhC [bacterium]|nr:xanthine dehydrogenase accessory protein XdhC [bacterium]